MDESHLKSANIIDKQKKDISSLKNEVKQTKQNASKEKLEMLYEETKSYQNFVGFMNEHLLLVRYEISHSNKVCIFWEGHKILQNPHLTFVYSTYRQK